MENEKTLKERFVDVVSSKPFKFGVVTGLLIGVGLVTGSRKHRDQELIRALRSVKLDVNVYQYDSNGTKEAFCEIPRHF